MRTVQVLLLLSLFLSFSWVSSSSSTDKPNILVVVVDDLGWNDISYHNSLFSTPNIENMAKEGILLNYFYTSPSCTPSRAAFMTGKYSTHTGLQDSVIHSTEPRGVSLSETFLSTKLKDAGYTTHAVGKWHLGMHTSDYVPLSRGFDYHYGILTGGGSHTKHFSVSQSFTPRGSDDAVTFTGYNIWDEGKISDDNFGESHSTYLYSGRTVKYMNTAIKQDSNPFFIYLAYQAVHDPIEVGNEKAITETTCNDLTEDPNDDPSIDWDNRKILCGMVSEIDTGLGNIRSNLERLDEWDNTLIFFFSDNGGNLAHGSSNFPLSGEKGQYWEGGVRVPAFVAGGYVSKKLAEAGLEPYEYDSLVHVTDFHQTILSVAGYTGDNENIDGVDMWDAFVSTKEAVREDLLVNINTDTFGGSGAIIVGDYKLMINGDPKESKIYTKVRQEIASYTGNIWNSATLSSIVDDVVSSFLPKTVYYMFNIKKNPSELTDGDCDDVEECQNLYDNDQFSDIQTALEAKWAEHVSTMEDSTFAWQDDGVLANPDWFAGIWAPWRETTGTAKAEYLGYPDIVIGTGTMDSFFAWLGIDKSCSSFITTKSTNEMDLLAAPSMGTVGTFVLYISMLMMVAGLIGYTIGKRSNNSSYRY